jgi:hypothetical protein
MSPVRIAVLAFAVLALFAVSASAQPIISAKSGVIANVEGKVMLDNQPIEASATHFPEIKENSVLSTTDGRAEILLPPGFVMRLGENASLKMLTNRLIDTRVELLSGSAVVEVDEAAPETNVTITLKSGAIRLAKSGVYRFDSEPGRLKVFQGSASVDIGGQTVLVSSGKMLSLAGGVAAVEKFDTQDTDALDNWSRRRAEAMALANVSAAKQVHDQYGNLRSNSWGYNPYYGVYTFIPMSGRACNSFYGYCYYSPLAGYNTYFAPPVVYNNVGNGGGYGGFNPGYSSMGGGSTSASSVSSAPSMSSAPAASAASTAASSAASSSAGHGSAAGGGHGK